MVPVLKSFMVLVLMEPALIASEKKALTFVAGAMPVAFSAGTTRLTVGAVVSGGHPFSVLAATVGQASKLSGTPSPSVSESLAGRSGQPSPLLSVPRGISTHASEESVIPSPSKSVGFEDPAGSLWPDWPAAPPPCRLRRPSRELASS